MLETVPNDLPLATPASIPSKFKTQVVGLDLLRFLAAACVVAYHYSMWLLISPDPHIANVFNPDIQEKTTHWLHFGWVGVEIFFLISGYVITYSAEGTSAWDFARSRALRLIPGVWLCAPLAFLIYRFLSDGANPALLFQMVRTVTFFPFLPSIDGIYWTLGVEICFYAYIFLLKFNKLDRFIPIFARAIGVISFLFWIADDVALAIWPDGHALHFYIAKISGFRVFQLMLFQHGCYFALGMIIREMQIKGLSLERLAFAVISFAASLIELVNQNALIGRITNLDLPLWPSVAMWIFSLVFCVAFIIWNRGILILIGARAAQLVRKIGLATYPLYLVHSCVIGAVAFLFAKSVPSSAVVAISAITSLVFAFVISTTFEPWLRTILGRLLLKSTNRVPNATEDKAATHSLASNVSGDRSVTRGD